MRTKCGVLVAGVLVAVIPLWAQPAAKAKAESRTWTPPRTSGGQPDLEGTWTNTTTPLERPAALAEQYLTDQEIEAYEKRFVIEQTGDRRSGGPEAGVARSYNEFWRDRGTKVIESRRTSLIVDPPDGKVPRLTPAAEKRIADACEQTGLQSTDGPDYLRERCLTRRLPMLPGPYNYDFQIVLTPRYVARVGPDEICYEFAVGDPTTFTRPWTAQGPMSPAEDEIFEYACQEGNYALADIRRGARAEDEKGLK
jgi:hypothetical protein